VVLPREPSSRQDRLPTELRAPVDDDGDGRLVGSLIRRDIATPLATLSDPSYEHEMPWPTSAVK
jgi:hypothetical protein